MNVTACLVTRGDVDMTPIYESLPPWPLAVWSNAHRPRDLGVYGRYAVIEQAETDVIYVQDDDCVLAAESFDALLAAYEPGKLVANMPERFRKHYPDSCLVGFGALFDRHLPSAAFVRMQAVEKLLGTDWFHRECDAVFTALTPCVLVDVPVEILDYAHAPDRLWKQPEHSAARAEMLAVARRVRDREAA